jgi:hypothetical protein
MKGTPGTDFEGGESFFFVALQDDFFRHHLQMSERMNSFAFHCVVTRSRHIPRPNNSPTDLPALSAGHSRLDPTRPLPTVPQTLHRWSDLVPLWQLDAGVGYPNRCGRIAEFLEPIGRRGRGSRVFAVQQGGEEEVGQDVSVSFSRSRWRAVMSLLVVTSHPCD